MRHRVLAQMASYHCSWWTRRSSIPPDPIDADFLPGPCPPRSGAGWHTRAETGDPRLVVPALAAEVGAGSVAITADFGPYGAARDRTVGEALSAAGRSLVTVDSPYVVAPGTARSSSGAPLRVFPPSAGPGRWRGGAPGPRSGFRFVGAPSDTTIDDIEAGVGRPPLSAWWKDSRLGWPNICRRPVGCCQEPARTIRRGATFRLRRRS